MVSVLLCRSTVSTGGACELIGSDGVLLGLLRRGVEPDHVATVSAVIRGRGPSARDAEMRPRTSRWSAVVALVLVATLVAGACAPDDDESVGAEATASPGAGDRPGDAGAALATVDARPSAGCVGDVADAVEVEPIELDVDGEPREALLTAPVSAPDEPLPLVLDIHGLMEGAQIRSVHSGLGAFGRAHGFVTVFPQGTGDPARWDAAEREGNPDLAYMDQLLDHVLDTRCIDEARVYATGLSYGAMMTSLLTCERSERFAAVAPVDGITAPEECDQQRTVPIVTTHGTEDPILLFNGGVGDLSSFLGGDGPDATTTTVPTDLDGEGYPATVATWARRNGCDPQPTDQRIGESVLHRVYDCPDGADVEFYVVEGGGHTWPGSEFSEGIEHITGPTTFEIDWNEIAWGFFQRHALAS